MPSGEGRVLKLFGIFVWLGFHAMFALEEAAGRRVFARRRTTLASVSAR